MQAKELFYNKCCELQHVRVPVLGFLLHHRQHRLKVVVFVSIALADPCLFHPNSHYGGQESGDTS